MKYSTGVFEGTGATLNVGLGFLPAHIELRNLTTGDELTWDIDWVKGPRFGVVNDVTLDSEGVTPGHAASAAAGLVRYSGAMDQLTAASTTVLIPSLKDRRDAGSGSAITLFTLDTAANKTGHFDAPVNTDLVGVGSKFYVKDKMNGVSEATIVALTSDGDAADNVTTDILVGSGEVSKLLAMYTHVGGETGDIPLPGFTLGASADVNQDGNAIWFRVGYSI